MDVIKELVTILGGTAIAVAALAWLARSIVVHFLSKDVEKFKIGLSAQYAFETERLRAELSRQVLEHEVKYRRVDEKVAERLDETYRRLLHFFQSVTSYIHPAEWPGEPSKEEKFKTASAANKAFWDYFLENRVYVPPRLYERIRDVADKLTTIVNEFAIGQRQETKGVIPKEGEDYWPNAIHTVQEEVDPLYAMLVAAIQNRLGVQDDDRTTGCDTP